VFYKGHLNNRKYTPDLICYDQVIVELKAFSQLSVVKEAQILNC
jgi:GxxExxY protein